MVELYGHGFPGTWYYGNNEQVRLLLDITMKKCRKGKWRPPREPGQPGDSISAKLGIELGKFNVTVLRACVVPRVK